MSAEAAVGRRAFKQIWIGATVCAAAFGATAASSAVTYVSSFPTELSRQQIAATTGRDAGLAVLLGPVSSIGTVGGYTFYKVFAFLTTIGAIWALLAATRLLRGEEDGGRWQLVMAGATRASRATAATLAALGAAVGVIFVGMTLLTLLAGRNPDVAFSVGGTLLFATAIVIPAAVFAAIGAVTSQLGRTRRAATGLGMVAFGVTFVVRMVADSGPATHWLLWVTPFGWTERMHPLTENNGWPLLPAALAVLALSASAVVMAARRDAGDGMLASRDVARLRPFGLGSAFGMTVRREAPVLGAWCVGALATGLMLGVIAKVTVTGVPPSSMQDTLDKFGVRGSFVNQYFGVAFLFVATIVALLPAGQIGAAADEETSGRLVHLLARSTRRTEWFAGRIALSGVAVLAAGLLAALGAWLGARSQGVDFPFATMLEAGINVVPVALVALGAGAVVLAIRPRIAATFVYSIIIWSLIIDLTGSLVSSLSWSEHVSLFHYMALAPAEPLDALALALTTATALVLFGFATWRFRRRDLQTA